MEVLCEIRKKRHLFFILVVCLGTTFSSLTGCTTTYSLNYTSAKQPKGEYKYAVISASSFDESVLQRFYTKYPSNKYEVVAVEVQRNEFLNKILPFLTGFGGACFVGFFGATLQRDAGLVVGMTAVSGTIGYLIGDRFKDKYIVTYVERDSM